MASLTEKVNELRAYIAKLRGKRYVGEYDERQIWEKRKKEAYLIVDMMKTEGWNVFRSRVKSKIDLRTRELLAMDNDKFVGPLGLGAKNKVIGLQEALNEVQKIITEGELAEKNLDSSKPRPG